MKRLTAENAKETMTLYGEIALTAKGSHQDSGHISKQYEIVEVVTMIGGHRVIRLREIDQTEINKKKKKIVQMLLERLNEEDSKTMKSILKDAIQDYQDDDIERIFDKLSRGEEPVKTREGCFKIIIGDGRKHNSEHITVG